MSALGKTNNFFINWSVNLRGNLQRGFPIVGVSTAPSVEPWLVLGSDSLAVIGTDDHPVFSSVEYVPEENLPLPGTVWLFDHLGRAVYDHNNNRVAVPEQFSNS